MSAAQPGHRSLQRSGPPPISTPSARRPAPAATSESGGADAGDDAGRPRARTQRVPGCAEIQCRRAPTSEEWSEAREPGCATGRSAARKPRAAASGEADCRRYRPALAGLSSSRWLRRERRRRALLRRHPSIWLWAARARSDSSPPWRIPAASRPTRATPTIWRRGKRRAGPGSPLVRIGCPGMTTQTMISGGGHCRLRGRLPTRDGPVVPAHPPLHRAGHG